jgi:phospholipid N-methyltransferase
MADEDRSEPFDSIESAQDFMNLLATEIQDSVRDLDESRTAALNAGDRRRVQAIDMALYKLKILNGYVHKSSRLLNDLRSLRRLLLQERTVEAMDNGDTDESIHWS